MKVRKLVMLTVLLVSAVIGVAVATEQWPGNPGPELARQSTGGGRWQSHRNGSDQNGWQLQLQRFDDDSIAGKIAVVGSPLIQHAQIVGHVTGTDVDGVLLDDNGKQVGTFSGSVFKKGASGTYTTADGDSGLWNWDGLPPGVLDHRPVNLDAGGQLSD